MTIRAVVFDIGGVLELSSDGKEPTLAFTRMIERWEARLGVQELGACVERMHLRGMLGACTETEWHDELRRAGRMSDAELASFLGDAWDLYLGVLNEELAAFVRSLRPRYKTALLSNSFVGARAREHERHRLGDLTDLIVYSHEEGIAKPDRRIYERTCERLGVRPEEAVFLDDVEAYVEGARAAGMYAVHFRDNATARVAIEARLGE
jgi:putative hydrolase of the HAD superfamily